MRNNLNKETEMYVCIFCNETIESGLHDPCAIRVITQIDRPRDAQKEQTFFCHISCLQSRAAIQKSNFYILDSDFPRISE